jgi:P27 family predicted phage terminase small subunit
MTKPPSYLSLASKKIWKAVHEDYELDLAADVVLTTLLEAHDRRQEARALIAKEGTYTKNRFGETRAHPAVAVERDAAAVMTRCWRLLGFDQEPRGDIGRPLGS